MRTIRTLPQTALVAFAVAVLLVSLLPAPAQAQQVISGDAPRKAPKSLDHPDFVGKWDFKRPGDYGEWKPFQAAGTFEAIGDVVAVTAKSQRPCLDLTGPYDAGEISSIVIRIRGIEVERNRPAGSGDGSMSGANKRVRVLPQVYQGTRIYFTRSPREKYDPASSFELELPLDGKFHVLTINPHSHPSWQGLIQKIRFDVGDFPNRYEVDYIYFRRLSVERKKGAAAGDKATSGVGAISRGSRN